MSSLQAIAEFVAFDPLAKGSWKAETGPRGTAHVLIAPSRSSPCETFRLVAPFSVRLWKLTSGSGFSRSAPIGACGYESCGNGRARIILYRAVDTDNTTSTETYSYRIKILNEEGKRRGNLEIFYLENVSQVEDIAARAIAPDGTVALFHDEVMDQEIVRAKKFRSHAKVLSIPNVQVGSIIEYTYRLRYKYTIPEQFKQSWNKIRFRKPNDFPRGEVGCPNRFICKAPSGLSFTPVNDVR